MIRLRRLVIGFCGSLSLQAATALPAQVPARLSDVEFRTLITGLSEPGGVFWMANNFTSNESDAASVIARLIAVHDTGGAYLGVGPEQNFSYIAAIRPRIAFIVDIRRQAFLQHLMYKALFELSANRVEFVSLLFARPRPSGLDSSTAMAAMWDRYFAVSPDTALARRTAGRIADRLTRAHGIVLDSMDTALLRYVYAMFVTIGPKILDEPQLSETFYDGYRLAGAWLSGDPSVTITLVDSISGQPVRNALVTFSSMANAFGSGGPSDSMGRIRLAPYAAPGPVRIDISAFGYDTAHVSIPRPGAAPFMVTVPLRRGRGCLINAAYPSACGPPESIARGRVGGSRASSAGTPAGIDFAALATARDSAGVPRSFLGTEAAFRVVKALHERNLIVPLVGNFVGPKTIRGVGEYLRNYRTTVTAFYVSNVLTVLFNQRVAAAFFQNAATLPTTPSSVVIDQGSRLCPMDRWIATGPTAPSYASLNVLCPR